MVDERTVIGRSKIGEVIRQANDAASPAALRRGSRDQDFILPLPKAFRHFRPGKASAAAGVTFRDLPATNCKRKTGAARED
ncbi:MAG: hypothetical protein DLM68_02985 [Hyphomicrobiales bacterium]|nr:MAG: hypothetical protein DLM68_02985 [Hyphomicrobiales bacterium]